MKLGVALRPTVFTPKEIVKIVAALDNRAKVLTTVFIPDVAAGAEPIELSIASLAASKRLHVGSGVIRITEHDTEQLARRILTAQSVSDGRFILGVGTGAVGKDPATKINAMFGKLSELKDKILQRKSATMPKVYIATLRRGIARVSAGRCQLPMNEVHGLAPSQDWFMHSLQSRCIGAMQEPVDRDSSGVNLEPFLVRNSVPQHQSFDSYS